MSEEARKLKLLQDILEHTKGLFEDSSKKIQISRRKLFIFSVVLLAIYVTNAIPTKITPLGIDFSGLEQTRLLALLSWVVAYFLFCFLVDACKFYDSRKHYRISIVQLNDEANVRGRDLVRTKFEKILWSLQENLSDFLHLFLPVIIGVLSIFIGQFPNKSIWLKKLFGG